MTFQEMLAFMTYTHAWIAETGHTQEQVYALQAEWEVVRDTEQEKTALQKWECYKRGDWLTVSLAFDDDTLHTKRFHKDEIERARHDSANNTVN